MFRLQQRDLQKWVKVVIENTTVEVGLFADGLSSVSRTVSQIDNVETAYSQSATDSLQSFPFYRFLIVVCSTLESLKSKTSKFSCWCFGLWDFGITTMPSLI
jgi:hypothetical protein